jgi:hypothetical protein
MKKFLAFMLVVFAFFVYSDAATAVVAGDASIDRPVNYRDIKLGTCNSGANDTIKTGNGIAYGPYSLCVAKGRPAVAGFRTMFSKACFSSGDTIQLGYQIINGSAITDTAASGWTQVDTIIGANGDKGVYVDLSSLPGYSIVFRLFSLDASTVIVQKPIRVYMKETGTTYFNAKP